MNEREGAPLQPRVSAAAAEPSGHGAGVATATKPRLVIDAGPLPLPMEIVDRAHRRVALLHSRDEVGLDPGRYWLRVRLPAGESVEWRLESAPRGGTRDWVLRNALDTVTSRAVEKEDTPAVLKVDVPVHFPARAIPPGAGVVEPVLAISPVEEETTPAALEAIPAMDESDVATHERAPWVRLSSRFDEHGLVPAAVSPVALRFVAFDHDGRARETMTPVISEMAQLSRDSTRLRLSVEAGPQPAPAVQRRAVFAQVRRVRDDAALTVALPLADTAGSTCWLYVSTHGGQLHVRAEAADDAVEVLREYLVTDSLLDAAALHGPLFQGQPEADPAENPIGALMAAHALMRVDAFRDPKRPDLLSWLGHVVSKCGWLPDVHALRGELCARRGDHKGAVTSFLQAARRGLPVFADSHSYIVGRLRTYRRAGHLDKLGNPLAAARAIRVGRELQRIAGYLEIAGVYTCLRGGVDADDEMRAAGWIVLLGNQTAQPVSRRSRGAARAVEEVVARRSLVESDEDQR